MQKGDVSDMIGLVERILSPSRVCEIRIMIQDFVTHERAVRLKTKYPDICMICNFYRIQPFLKVLTNNNKSQQIKNQITSLQSLTGSSQGRITTQGDPSSHYREWVC